MVVLSSVFHIPDIRNLKGRHLYNTIWLITRFCMGIIYRTIFELDCRQTEYLVQTIWTVDKRDSCSFGSISCDKTLTVHQISNIIIVWCNVKERQKYSFITSGIIQGPGNRKTDSVEYHQRLMAGKCPCRQSSTPSSRYVVGTARRPWFARQTGQCRCVISYNHPVILTQTAESEERIQHNAQLPQSRQGLIRSKSLIKSEHDECWKRWRITICRSREIIKWMVTKNLHQTPESA